MSSSNPQLPLDKFLATAGKLTMPELVQWPTTWAEWSNPYRKEGAPTPTEAAIVLCISGSDDDKNAQYWSAAYDHTLAHYLLGHATFMGYGDDFETIKSALSGFVEYVEYVEQQKEKIKTYVVICGERKINNYNHEFDIYNFIADTRNNITGINIYARFVDFPDECDITHISEENTLGYMYICPENNILCIIKNKMSQNDYWKHVNNHLDRNYFNFFIN